MAVNQLRTHSIARNAFSWRSLLSTGWRWHFAPFSLGLLEEEKRMTTKILFFFLFCLGVMVLLWTGLGWPNSLPERDCGRRANIPVFQRKKWQLWPCDAYHLNLNTHKQIFYRNGSWVLKSLPPCRTLSWRILSFGVRPAQSLLLLRRKSKRQINIVKFENKLQTSWKYIWLMQHLSTAYVHCWWTSQIETKKHQKQWWMAEFSVSACQKKVETHCSAWIYWKLLCVLIPVADCFCHRSQTYKIAFSSSESLQAVSWLPCRKKKKKV